MENYLLDAEEIEKIMIIMGYDWTKHYDCHSDFIVNLNENLHFNFPQ